METIPLRYHSCSSPKPTLLSSKSRAWMKVFESHPDLKDLHIPTVYWPHVPRLLWRLLSEQRSLGGIEPPPGRSSSIPPVPRGLPRLTSLPAGASLCWTPAWAVFLLRRSLFAWRRLLSLLPSWNPRRTHALLSFSLCHGYPFSPSWFSLLKNRWTSRLDFYPCHSPKATLQISLGLALSVSGSQQAPVGKTWFSQTPSYVSGDLYGTSSESRKTSCLSERHCGPP